MMKITNLNFQNQTIEKIEVDCENVDNVEIKLTKTKFNIVIVKDGKSIKKEIKKKNVPEVVDLVIEDIEEVFEPVTEVIEEEPVTEVIEEEPVTKVIEEEPVKEVIEEESVTEVIEKEVVTEVIEEEIEEVVVESVIDDIQEEIEEVVAEPVMITLGKLKDLLKQQIPKKNTLDFYCRTI